MDTTKDDAPRNARPLCECGHTLAQHRWDPGYFANLTGCKRFDECGCYLDRKELWIKLGKPAHRFVQNLLRGATCRLCGVTAPEHRGGLAALKGVTP